MYRDKLPFLLIICFGVASSCSQINSSKNRPVPDIYVGSTPCDSIIRSTLTLPTGSVWDHIIWELNIFKNDAATFGLSAHYMGIDPKTNGYVDTGIKIFAKGKYTTLTGGPENPILKLYHLTSENLQSPIFLIEMDSNILHFANSNKKFMVGNSAFGYVLNRIQR